MAGNDSSNTITVSSRGRKKQFTDLPSLEAWLGEERKTFAWAFDNLPGQESFKAEFEGRWRKIENGLIEAQNKPSDERRMRRLLQSASQLFTESLLVTSDSPAAKFVSRLREKRGDQYASYALATITKIERSRWHPDDLEAAIETVLWMRGIKRTTESEQAALEALREKWDTEYDKHLRTHAGSLDTLREDNSRTLQELAGDFKQRLESFTITEAEQQKSLEELIDQTKKKLDEIETFYRTELALQEPVRYWSTKSSRHDRWAIVYGLVAVLGATVVGAYFISQVETLIGLQRDIHYADVIILITLATLGIWALRIIVRLLLSNVHLSSDARERAVLIQTFLALHEKGDMNAEERRLMLESIFRPGSSGLVKDDSAPHSLSEVLSRMR